MRYENKRERRKKHTILLRRITLKTYVFIQRSIQRNIFFLLRS